MKAVRTLVHRPVWKVALAAMLAIGFAQLRAPASQSRGSVDGIVVRAGTTDPISSVDVELTRIEGTKAFPLAEPTYLTDARTGPTFPNPAEVFTIQTKSDGRFRFADLPAGTYRLLAERAGGTYYPAEYGQRDPKGPGTDIVLAEGETFRDARIEMTTTGTISGRVVDEDGNPAGRVRVMAIESHWNLGRQELGLLQGQYTNDLGEYRLFFLRPGRYYIAAKPEDPRRQNLSMIVLPVDAEPTREVLPAAALKLRLLANGETITETIEPVYYGGGSDIQSARPIDLSPGANISGIDIALGPGRARARTIRGIVVDAMGQPAGRVAVVAVPPVAGPSVVIPSVMSAADGSFELTIGQGPYLLRGRITDGARLDAQYALVRTTIPGTSLPSGLVPIPAGEDSIDHLTLWLRPGLNIQGRVIVEGRDANATAPDISGLQLRFVADKEYFPEPNPTSATDGAFTILGIQPGDYHMSISPILQVYGSRPNPLVATEGLQDYYVKSIRFGSSDVLNDGFHIGGSIEGELEVVLGSNAGVIEGQTIESGRGPVSNATVVLIPDGASRIRPDLYRSVNSDRNGRFTIRGITPGDYRLIAWEQIEDGIWFDPEFARVNRGRGTLVHIVEGQNPMVNVSVVRP